MSFPRSVLNQEKLGKTTCAAERVKSEVCSYRNAESGEGDCWSVSLWVCLMGSYRFFYLLPLGLGQSCVCFMVFPMLLQAHFHGLVNRVKLRGDPHKCID